MRDRIPIKRELIPYGFDILLGRDKFNFRITHNKTSDLFVIRLKKNDKVICYEPIIYGVELFRDIYVSGSYPVVRIEPLDESDNECEVTSSNFSKTVFLTIDNGKG